jgi:hypothetical protein
MANKNDNLPDAATVMKSKSFSSSNMNKHMKIVVIGGSGAHRHMPCQLLAPIACWRVVISVQKWPSKI